MLPVFGFVAARLRNSLQIHLSVTLVLVFSDQTFDRPEPAKIEVDILNLLDQQLAILAMRQSLNHLGQPVSLGKSMRGISLARIPGCGQKCRCCSATRK